MEELLRMMTACLAPTAPTLVIMGNEDPGFKGINKTLTGPSNPEAIWVRGLGCGEGGEGTVVYTEDFIKVVKCAPPLSC